MMATRNPKVVPKRKPSKPQARESTLSKDQGELNRQVLTFISDRPACGVPLSQFDL